MLENNARGESMQMLNVTLSVSVGIICVLLLGLYCVSSISAPICMVVNAKKSRVISQVAKCLRSTLK